MNLTSCTPGDTLKAIKNIVLSDENSIYFDEEKISKDDVLNYESPYKDMTTTYFKDQLTEEEKLMYDSLVYAYEHGNTEVGFYFDMEDESYEASVMKVIQSLCAENPFFDWNYNYEYGYDPVEARFFIKDAACHSEFLNKKIKAYEKAKEILSTMPGGLSDYDKLVWIYDYITTNINYLDKSELDQYMSSAQPYVYDALIMKTTQCSGFSDTLTMMCNLANIQCITVGGFTDTGVSNNMGHAWNLVKLDGEFYNCDVTNDAAEGDGIELKGLKNKEIKKLKLNFLKSDASIYSGVYRADDKTVITFPKANNNKYDNKANLTVDNLSSSANINLIGKKLMDSEKYVIVHLSSGVKADDPALNDSVNKVLNYLCNNIVSTRQLMVTLEYMASPISNDIVFVKTVE